jgi:hypothetical protein
LLHILGRARVSFDLLRYEWYNPIDANTITSRSGEAREDGYGIQQVN